MIKAIYDLDMTPRRSLPVIINVSQNDDLGRTLVFNLFSSTGTWTAPDSATATLEGGKPDGKFFSFNCTYSKGTVTAIIQQQMTAVSGKVVCKVKVQSGDKVIESAPIYMMVDAAGIPDGADMSKSDINDAVAVATKKIVEQVAGSIPEDYSKLNQSVDELKQDMGNVINDISWNDNTAINGTSGQLKPQNNWSVSNYIFVVGGSYVTYIACTTNKYIPGIAFYDKNYILLQSLSNNGISNTQPVTITAPQRAAYARISCETSDKQLSYLQCQIAPIENRVENPIIKNLNILDTNLPIEVTNYALLVDLYVGTDWLNGEFRRSSQSDGHTSTSITQLDKTKDIFSNNVYAGQAVFFDSNKTYISRQNLFVGSPVKKENYPNNAEYVCFWWDHSKINSDKWATYQNGNLPFTEYSHNIKIKGIRPRIDIFVSDSEIDIFKKMCDAIYTRDCDVYFEPGYYKFDLVYDYIKESYNNQGDAFEMLLGGNCKYYMYGSTFYAKYSGTNILPTGYSLFGCHRHSDSFEVFGGTWIAENCVYVMHDESSGEAEPYHRIYHNVTMKYISGSNSSWISKCVGGGMGLNGHSVFDGCTFLTDNFYNGQKVPSIQWHGCKTGTKENPANFILDLENCYLESTIITDKFGETYSNNNGVVQIRGCTFEKAPSIGEGWDAKQWNNEIRNNEN